MFIKNLFKNKISILSSLIAVLLMIGTIISCEVGLGSSVDTQPPTVSVNTPTADYIIRDAFTMEGDCSDEQGLHQITVSLRNTHTSKIYPSAETPFVATINKEQTNWECLIDPLSADLPIPDGSYEATVIATDKAGRKTIATKSFKIDNTAPLLILTRPSTKLNEQGKIDSSATDTYGQELTITGQVADDNNVDLMEIEVYDDKNNKITTVPLANVPPTIDLTVATWQDENYNLIYGKDKEGTKYYYCKVTVHDEARKIPFDENDKGNTLSYYYYNDDIYTDLLSTYKATEVYKILNGTYTKENIKYFKDKNLSDEEISKKVTEVKSVLSKSQNQTVAGTFSLNPENNPYFEIDGYKEIHSDSLEQIFTTLRDENLFTNGNPLNISILVGLDQAPIIEDSIGIRLNKIEFINNEYKIDTENPIWYIKPAAQATTENDKACRELLTKVGSNYKVSLKLTSFVEELINDNTGKKYILPTVKVNNAYLVTVVGKDKNGTEFVESFNQGLFLESRGNPPKIKITEPSGSTVYLKKDSSVSIKGSVECEDFTTVNIYVNDELIKTAEATWTSSVDNPSVDLNGEGTGNWGTLTVSPEAFNQTESKEYYITVKATSGSKESEKELTIYYDVEGPVIDIYSVSPKVTFADANGIVRSDNVNGIFEINARIADAFNRVDTTVNKPKLNIYKGNNTLPENLLYTTTADTANTTWTVNTTEDKFAEIDNTEITIEVVATDEPGNIAKKTEVVYLNQASDKPVIELTNKLVSGIVDEKDYSGNSYPNGGTENIIMAEAPLSAKITDDDEIEQVEVTIKLNGLSDENNTTKTVYPKAEINSNPWPLSHTAPKDIGTYLAEIKVTDKNGITSEITKFWFKIDAGAPTVNITLGDYYGTTNQIIPVTGTVKGFGGLVIYKNYNKETSVKEKITGQQPNETDISFIFEDDFKVTQTTEGKYTQTYTVIDSNNRLGTGSLDYIVDLNPPEIAFALQIPLEGISSTDYRFSGATKDFANEFTSGVESVFYQIIKADAASSTVESDGWSKITATTTWSFYQKFKEATAPQEAEGLPEGSYKLYVFAKDKAGNVSEIKTEKFDVDLNKPTVDLFFNGTSKADNAVEKTNKNYEFSFSVSDTCKLNANPYELTIIKDEKTLSQGTDYSVSQADANGKYKVTLTNSADGNYVFKVIGLDWKNKDTIKTLNITLDKTAPTIEVISPATDEWQTSHTISIKGTAEDASGVTSITAKDSQGNSINVTGTTSWTVKDIQTVEGESTYTFSATDTLGNTSSNKTFVLKVDHNDPEISQVTITKAGEAAESIENNASIMTNKNFTLSGKVSDSYKLANFVLSITDGTQTKTPNVTITKQNSQNWNWSKTFSLDTDSLTDGIWTITVTATDTSGKTAIAKYKVTVDTVAPVITKPTLTFDTENRDGWFNKNAGTISGSVTDGTSKIANVSYLVTNERFYIDENNAHSQLTSQTFDNTLSISNNNYSKKHSFAEGTNYVYIKAEDNAGNISYYGQNGDVTCQIDTNAPQIIFEQPANGSMISQNIPVSYRIKFQDEGSGFLETSTATVKLMDESNAVYSYTGKIINSVVEQTIPTANLENISTDTPKIVVTVTDKAGNTTESALSLAMDNTAPTVNIANPAAETVNGKVNVNGTASDNVGLAKVQIYRTKLAGETTDATINSKEYKLLNEFEGVNGYNWNLGQIDTSSSPYTDGAKIEFLIKAIDTAGNEVTSSKTVTIDQDADRPIVKFSNLNLAGMSSSSSVWNKQETIYGTITDDDGIKSLYISSDAGQNWGENLYKDGAWEYTFQADGNITLLFKVVDSEGTEFVSTSGSGMSKSPKLIDSQATPNKFGYKVNDAYPNTSNTKIYLVVDTQNPIFKAVYYNKEYNQNEELVYPLPNNTNWKIDTSINTDLFGGPQSKFYLYVVASDANGINSIDASLDSDSSKVTIVKTKSIEIPEGNGTTKGTIAIISIDTSSDSNWKKIEIATSDKSGRENKLNYSIQLDNSSPIIKFTSHAQKAQVYGSSLVTVRGNADDVQDLYLKVTDSSATPAVSDLSTWTKFNEYTSPSAWAIEFDGESPINIAGSTEFKAKSLNKYYDDLFEPNSDDKNADSKAMYIWVYGIDSLGNKNTPVYLELSVNPAGDKPTIEFSYPENNNIVGGTVRVTGSSKVADATASVESVWLQIDPSYDEIEFNSNWETELSALITDGSGNYITDYEIQDAGGTIGRGIKASGSTTSWNLPINTAGEFNNADGSNRKIAIKAYAVSSSGKTSESATVYFEIDPKAPVIGSRTPLELVQYANGASSGTVVRRQKYTANMWIAGRWYLTGSIEDDSGIKEIKLNGTSIINDNSKLSVDYDNPPSSGTHKNFQINIPVGETTGFGSKTYVLWAQEGSEENKDTGNIEIRLNYDNQVPEFVTTGLTPSGNTIEQSNNTYTLSGTFAEPSGASGNQSGFGRIAMFFTRTVKEGNENKTYVIDPMISKGNSQENRYSTSDFEQDSNGLYWRTYNITNIAGNEITLNEEPHKNVRIGGLCKIDNVDYLIQKVEGSTVTIVGTITTNATVAKFAVAQIIDNLTIENGTTQAYDETISSPIARDDGDQMVEGISNSGTTYTWTVSINSSLIYDGPININFVAFDAAGNAIKNTYSGIVSNNQPRIAGVKFGTDENGNGSVEENELNKGWSGIYANVSSSIPAGYITMTQKATSLSIPEDLNTSALKIKGKTVVKPEIVGGNSGLGYTYSVGTYSTETTTDLSNEHSDSNDIRDDLDIAITVEDFIKNNISEGAQTFTFNIWDKTEGLTYGTNSQKAQIKINMNVAVQDTESPKVGLKEFYWNSETDNSLYQNSRANGHIELKDDLTDTFTTALDALNQEASDASKKNKTLDTAIISKVKDTDPKVSGKITFHGIATDNTLLKAINVKIPGLTKDSEGNDIFVNVATRNNSGVWQSTGTLENNGWAFEIQKDASGNPQETFSQETGHTVHFLLHWDTAKIQSTVATDVIVEVQAVDRGKASYTGNALTYTSNAVLTQSPDNTDSSYKVDVVPYITNISRNKAYSTKRARSGAIPLLRKEEVNILEGFNIDVEVPTDKTLEDLIYLAITKDTAGSEHVKDMRDLAKYNDSGDLNPPANSDNMITFRVSSNAKDGYLSMTVNGIPALNNINKNKAQYNLDTETWSDNRFVRIWDDNDKFGNEDLAKNPAYPAMSMSETGDLYASFTNYSKHSVYYTEIDDEPIPVFRGYDSPEETTILVTGSKVNVAYLGNYQSGGNPNNWTHSRSDAGGLHLFDPYLSTLDELGDNASKWTDYDGHYMARFELLYHDKQFQQFKNFRLARKDSSANGRIHTAYYDIDTMSIHYSNISMNMTKVGNQLFEASWVNIDGGYDEHDTEAINGTLDSKKKTRLADEAKNIKLENAQFTNGLTRASATGEYVGIDLTKDTHFPVLAYFDSENKVIKLARANAENPKKSEGDWTVQRVITNTADPNYTTSNGNYIDMQIDDEGFVHVVFVNGRGELIYVKSTNIPTEENPSYEFGDSVVIAENSPMNLDITIRGTTPYIGYLSSLGSCDGLNVAFLDYNLDYNNDDKPESDGAWETISAPLTHPVSNHKATVEVHPNPTSSDAWGESAHAYYSSGYYRVAYYIGNGEGHQKPQ